MMRGWRCLCAWGVAWFLLRALRTSLSPSDPFPSSRGSSSGEVLPPTHRSDKGRGHRHHDPHNPLLRPSSSSSSFSSSFSSSSYSDAPNEKEPCPFPDSPLRGKIFVYPIWGDASSGWTPQVPQMPHQRHLWSKAAQENRVAKWPWLDYDRQAHREGVAHYAIEGEHAQYTTELLIRDLLTHPSTACLRTFNPDEAALFYVPYWPSTEFHRAGTGANPNVPSDYDTSPYGEALHQLLQYRNYTLWEDLFGFTKDYWERRNQSDHLLVFSEPLHGYRHPRNRRGSYHYMHTQFQLSPAIVASVELSATFVTHHPRCASKNVLLPYPNPDGRWYNGKHNRDTRRLLRQLSNSTTANPNHYLLHSAATSPAAMPAEREAALAAASQGHRHIWGHHSNDADVDKDDDDIPRPAALYYAAGNHGRCKKLRRALEKDYQTCSPSYQLYHRQLTSYYPHGMRLSTYCPAPGGDSPSAKRMFDCVHAGSIPVVLTQDFVWPFSTDLFGSDANSTTYGDDILRPSDFALRFEARDFLVPTVECQRNGRNDMCQAYGLNHHRPHSNISVATPTSLETRLASEISNPNDIRRMRQYLRTVSDEYFAWYARRPDLPDDPLRSGVLPDGGAARKFVKVLEDRAYGKLWPACESELQAIEALPPKQRPRDPANFKC